MTDNALMSEEQTGSHSVWFPETARGGWKIPGHCAARESHRANEYEKAGKRGHQRRHYGGHVNDPEAAMDAWPAA